MRNGFLGTLLVSLGGAGLAAAQFPGGYPPAYPAAYPAATASPYPSFRTAPMTWPTQPTPVIRPAAAVTPAPAAPVYSPYPRTAWPVHARPVFPAQPALVPAPPAQQAPQQPTPPAKQPEGGEPIPVPPTPREPVLDPPLPPEQPKSNAVSIPDGMPLLCDEAEASALPPPERELSHETCPPWHGPRGYCGYGRVDFLLWWINQRTAPPLLSTGPLGAPGTVVLMPDLSFDNQQRLGSRATLGTWLGRDSRAALEVSGLWLAERSPQFSTGGPVLARPYLDVTTGQERALPLAGTGGQTGAASIDALSRLWGGEANLRVELCRVPGFHLDALCGIRYLQIDDSLEIVDATFLGAAAGPAAGSSIVSSDRFGARNQFWGGQLGVEAELSRGRYFVNAYGKVALGPSQQTVTIGGTTVTRNAAGAVRSSPFGLLAQATNIGRYERNEFLAVPEFGINVGMQLTDNLRLTAGYTFLYVSDVVRGGDQVDRGLNLTQAGGPLVGERRPAFSFRESDFWAQGLNLGLEFRY